MNLKHPAYLPKIIGHRGACGHAPENTLASLRKAQALGVEAVEFDTTISADGHAIVMHDFNVERCSNGEGPVVLKSLSDIQNLDAGSWFSAAFSGERIPLLKDALDLVASSPMALNLEIKPTLGWEVPTARAVAKVVGECWPTDANLLVSSMSPTALEVFHDLQPDRALGLIVYAVPEDWQAQMVRYHCASLHCFSEFVTADLVKAVHDQGYRLHVYTVNAVDHAKALFALGVDAVFTDFPDQLAQSTD